MSGIAVVFEGDGRPVAIADVARLTAPIAHRGPDGIAHWIDGPAGLGHCRLATTPEAASERQPLADPASGRCLTFDGRLDNRAELSHTLAEAGCVPIDATDPALVLAAYRRWGERCPEHLLGDFAFALWDPARRAVVCARDPLGKRPFCYAHDGARFLAGSEIQQLLADPRVPRAPDEGIVAEHLANAITDAEGTLFQGLRRLPAAHTLVVDSRGARLARYWSPDPAHEIRYRDEGDYGAAFAELLIEAVRCRCRASGAVGAELSGGLDSSSITAISRELQRGGGLPGRGVEGFSLVFPGLPCDERPFIDEVTTFLGLRTNVIDGRDPPATPQAAGDADLPFYPNGTMANGLKELAAEKGFRVLLTGFGGDDWLTGSPMHLADDIRRLRFDRILAAPPSPARLYRRGVLPLIPRPLRRAVRRLISPPRHRTPSWITKPFLERSNLMDRLVRPTETPSFPTFAQRDIYTTATSAVAFHGTEMEERLTAAFGLEQRHPFDDLRLVTWALAVPEDQRWRGHATRVVLREAMRGRLPEAVRTRTWKPDFSVLVARALLADGPAQFDRLAVEDLGWVDGLRVRQMYEQMTTMYARGDQCYPGLAWSLWMVHAVDHWYRAVFTAER